jgi:hypothetical protein
LKLPKLPKLQIDLSDGLAVLGVALAAGGCWAISPLALHIFMIVFGTFVFLLAARKAL